MQRVCCSSNKVDELFFEWLAQPETDNVIETILSHSREALEAGQWALHLGNSFANPAAIAMDPITGAVGY